MEKEFIIFSKDFLFIEDNLGNKHDVPQYVSKAFKRYRYYSNEGILRKQCVECKTWHDVMMFSEGKWIDIHHEDEIHLMKGISGFSPRCSKCSEEQENKEKLKEIEEEKNQKFSLYIKPSNKKYLELASQLQNMNMSDLINQIVEKEKEKNSVEKLAKKLYENLIKK